MNYGDALIFHPGCIHSEDSSDKKTSWSTIGVSSDIVEASWKALIDSFEYKLMILTS